MIYYNIIINTYIIENQISKKSSIDIHRFTQKDSKIHHSPDLGDRYEEKPMTGLKQFRGKVAVIKRGHKLPPQSIGVCYAI